MGSWLTLCPKKNTSKIQSSFDFNVYILTLSCFTLISFSTSKCLSKATAVSDWNLIWNGTMHDSLIHICMKQRTCLISITDTKYAIYIHYTLIISILTFFFKSNWVGVWGKGFLLWSVNKDRSRSWHLTSSIAILLVQRSFHFFFFWLGSRPGISTLQVCDSSTRLRWMINKSDEIHRPTLSSGCAECQGDSQAFSSYYTILHEKCSPLW